MEQAEWIPTPDGLVHGNWSDSMLLALVVTGHIMRGAFESFVGTPFPRLRLLGYMYTKGELSQADLQRHLAVDGATITRQVKQMEADGLLQRRPDPKDNRFTLVALTDLGRSTVETLVKRGQEFQQLAVQNVDEEQMREALAVLRQLRANLQALASVDHCAGHEHGEHKMEG